MILQDTSPFPQEDLRVFHEISNALKDLPVLIRERFSEEDIELSIHVLAGAISDAFGLTLVHGWFSMERIEHSWVVTSNNNFIDPSPFGTFGGPIMINAVDDRCFKAYRSIYIPNLIKVMEFDFNNDTYRYHRSLVHKALKVRQRLLPLT